MSDWLQNPRARIALIIFLVVLAAANGIVHWPRHHATVARQGPTPGAPGEAPNGAASDGMPPRPSPAMQARMEARLQKMTPEQRARFQARRQEDEAFFASIQELPADERRQKMREHFAQNPPPDDADGDGGPGGAGGPRIPPPDERYGMDQNIAADQESGNFHR